MMMMIVIIMLLLSQLILLINSLSLFSAQSFFTLLWQSVTPASVIILWVTTPYIYLYRGADKSLARPGRKQARKHVRDAREFNNIQTRAVIKFFPLQGKAPKEIHAIFDRNIRLFPSWPS